MTLLDKARHLAGEVTDPETRAALEALCEVVSELERRKGAKRESETTETTTRTRRRFVVPQADMARTLR